MPIFFILQNVTDENGQILINKATGKPAQIYEKFWTLFGASNQLLAALTLLGVTVWLWQTKRVWWVWLVTGLPCVWMYAMSSWALYLMTMPKFYNKEKSIPNDWRSRRLGRGGITVLAALMLFEAIRVLLSNINRGTPQPQLKPA